VASTILRVEADRSRCGPAMPRSGQSPSTQIPRSRRSQQGGILPKPCAPDNLGLSVARSDANAAHAMIEHGLQWLAPYVAAYGAVTLFVLIYLESFGVPVPGESAVIASSLLAAHGDLSITALFVAVFFGAVLGDSTGYAIGHFGGRPLLLRFGSWVKLTPERLDKLEATFRTKGAIIVITARFVVVLRQLNGIIAGAVAMPWLRFLAANAVGALLWVSTWTLGPYFFTAFFRHVLHKMN
jgi:membrane protein DedA with SNARE-associated domain